MKGITPLAEEGLDRERWRTLSEAATDTYMRGWIGPGDMALTGAGVADVATAVFPYTLFPDGVLGQGKVNLWTRPRWHGCGVRLKVWYTSNAGAVAAFGLTVGVRQIRAGVNFAGLYAPLTQALTPAGPAVAQDVLSFEYVSAPGLISSAYDILSFRFIRDGAADANNGEYWQLLAYYEFLESP